ncbi:hypothetical protein PIB30_077193, partial [Stylosanthes scabra]|nr:hypothetical protein [Stylosanthes scabra]
TINDTTKKVDAQATTENTMEESSKKQENQQQQHSAATAKPAARKETNIPFPQQIRKEVKDKQFSNFLEIFRKL